MGKESGDDMKKRIGVLTLNDSIYNKIRLLLRKDAEVVRATGTEDCAGLSLLFTDLDISCPGTPTVRLGNSDGCDIPLPFRHEEILRTAEDSEDAPLLTLADERRCAVLAGEEIKLTDVEYRLLSELYRAEGDYVHRDVLLSKIWGEGYDPGVVNVYIHYLRQKLERGDRRIILSSRKEGYGIDKRYRRKREC